MQKLDYHSPTEMSHPGSKIYSSRLVMLEYTNRFSSPYVPKNFKPQFKLETKDSKTEDHPFNPNQGDTVDRYRQSPQEISEEMDVDFESKFIGPPQANQESRKEIGEIRFKEPMVFTGKSRVASKHHGIALQNHFKGPMVRTKKTQMMKGGRRGKVVPFLVNNGPV
uniref:Uncharacterized protein n=1 Tax=Cannabis sativa TaxID=3483 RepID=A0A803NIT8_CANSA